GRGPTGRRLTVVVRAHDDCALGFQDALVQCGTLAATLRTKVTEARVAFERLQRLLRLAIVALIYDDELHVLIRLHEQCSDDLGNGRRSVTSADDRAYEQH